VRIFLDTNILLDVTRDATGFAGSRVPVLSPEEFLRRFPV